MSLARTALRLAVIEALFSHPAVAAQCGERIYDSRIGDFNDKEVVPVIVVTTEELSGEAWNAQNGGAPFEDACDLVLEIGMAQFVQGDQGDFLFQPGTDAELEAGLDLIEQCAEWILTLGRTHPRAPQKTAAGRLLLEAVTRRVSKRTSSRFAPDDGGEQLAIHLLRFRVELKGEDIETYAVPPGPFGILPDPLRTVAQSLVEGSSGYLTCLKIAQQIAGTATPAPKPPSPPVVIPDPSPGVLPTFTTTEFPQVP